MKPLIETDHDFDLYTNCCRKCGLPRYGLGEFPQLVECAVTRDKISAELKGAQQSKVHDDGR